MYYYLFTIILLSIVLLSRHSALQYALYECCINKKIKNDATADGRHPVGKRDYDTTAPNAPISSFRLHCRAMEGVPGTLQDVCQCQHCA